MLKVRSHAAAMAAATATQQMDSTDVRQIIILKYMVQFCHTEWGQNPFTCSTAAAAAPV